jgi:uncharacterized protein (TIGR02246 family)
LSKLDASVLYRGLSIFEIAKRLPNSHTRLPSIENYKTHKMMTIRKTIPLLLALSMPLVAQEDDSPIASLRQAAENYVIAYNDRDAAALSELFTEEGELVGLGGEEVTSGRKSLMARFEQIFAGESPPSIAIEVDSVRLVAAGLAIEDGTAHYTPAEEGAIPDSLSYTAVLQKNEEGDWLIASTRILQDTSAHSRNLAPLAALLSGDWTALGKNGVRLDLAIGWDQGGKILAGEMLTTASDADPQVGTMRFVWDAMRESIISTFTDQSGGSTEGIWSETEDGWLIHSKGMTADGELTLATQRLTTGEDGALLWSISNEVIDGEMQPSRELRLVKQAPAPSED